MRQCPDCEEKDRVVIAGKVFCADCGTPWQPADPSEEVAYKQKSGLDDSAASVTASAPAATAAAPPVQATPAPAASVSAPPSVAAPSAPALQVAPAAQTPPPAPTPAPTPADSIATQPVAPPAPPVEAPTPAPAPTPTPAPVDPVVAQPVAPPAPPVEAPIAEPQSQIGSEIPSLDSKDESVLSDSQIKEMAAATPSTQPSPTPAPPAPVASVVASATPDPIATPVPDAPPAPSTTAVQPATAPVSTPPAARPPSGRVLNDVVAPPSNAVIAQPPAAAVAAAAPDSAQTPAPATNTTTVAGVTMSRDDALKLALGEDAVPEKAEKSGPARPTAVVMTVIGLALLGAFLWQANASDISVKLASLRAGLTASVPGFVPGGWGKAQSLKANSGGVSYELVKDGKTLKIEQQKSDWDSQAVLEQHVLKHSTDYLALQSQGLTIYVFGDNQAAWVNQGTFYTLSGDHGIEQDDIIRMATSL